MTAQGVNLRPYTGFPGSQTVLQTIKPLPQYTGNLSPVGAPVGKSWYDAIQTTFTKRFSHGLVANANYTYPKTLALTKHTRPVQQEPG